ncbi:MAG: hypothetical protein ACW99V_04440 [Candidatus Thorarchaeota archaeon]|jgi:hypothetical protein
MDELLSDNDDIRRNAGASLVERASSDPEELEPRIPELLGYIQRTSDDIVSVNIASAVSKICEIIPGTGQKYSSDIIDTLDFLSSREMTDDGTGAIINSAAVQLFVTQQHHLSSTPPQLKQALPTIFKYLRKESSVKWSAIGVITQVSMENPKMLESHAGEIILLISQGVAQLTPSLSYLYTIKPEEFEKNLEVLLQVYQTDKRAQSTLLSVFLEISKKRPELLEPHIELFKAGLTSPMSASSVSMMLSEIARTNPMAVYPYLSDLKQSIEYVEVLKYTVPNLLGLIGRTSEDVAREILPFLAELLVDAEQNVAVAVLSEFRNLGDMNRELLEPYIMLIRGFTDDPQEYVREQANHIIDFVEGRDIHSLAAQIEEHRTKLREAAVSVEILKEYVESNVEMLKKFIADVVKKLPMPVKFSTEGRIRKILQLHFVCSKQTERCLYPDNRPFITETKAWHRWLKIAMSAVKIGKAIIFPIETSEAIDAVREAYDAYRNKDDKDFLDYISEPFLTSEEQDNLVNQLRDARFFEVFNYDPQAAGWACLMCKPPG